MPVVRISEELFQEIQKYAVPLVDNFETALWKALRTRGTNSEELKMRKSKSRALGELTPPKDFWKPILNTLSEKGGTALRPEIFKILENKLESRLTAGDKECNRDGTAKWVKQVDYQRLAMANEGLLRKHSPHGTWEITDIGRQWLARH